MNLFEFANPSGWWWAALAVPIVLLYVLKIRLRRQPVSTLLFWDQIFDEKKPRSWWQRLRHLLSLLLQLAFLMLLVSALVDPLWSWQKKRQRRIALIVDNSASMQATEGENSTRLAEAKRAANALVRSLRSGDRMAVLSAGGRPRVTIGMTNHQRSLLDVIDSLPATDGPTDVFAAVDMAQRLLSDQDVDGEIVVLSDGCFDGVDQLQETGNVTLYGFGANTDNVGITRYQVRRSLLDSIGYQVLVDVTNFSEQTRTCRLELNLGESLVDVIPMELDPDQTITRIVDHTSTEGGSLTATLDVEDGFSADNIATAVLPKRMPIPIVLASDGNLFLKSVLESIPLVDLRIVSEAPSNAPANGILVLDRKVPSQLPKGRVLVVDPQGDCDAWTLGELIPQPIVAKVNADSPLTQHVRLDNVTFPEARLLQLIGETQMLIQDPLDQPLLARLRRPHGDAVVLTCSLEKGDLPLRIAFPVLMKNAIEWFQGNTGELRAAVSTGQLVSVNVPSRSTKDSTTPVREEAPSSDGDDLAVVERADAQTSRQDFVLVSPSQDVIPIATSDDQATIGPLLETGLWTIRPATDEESNEASNPQANSKNDERLIHIACNLADPAESDLRPRAQLADVSAFGILSLGGRSLWFYFTLIATALIVTEWWLYQRRIVG